LALQWQSERDLIRAAKDQQKALEKLRAEAEIAERAGNLDRVAEIRYGKVPKVEAEIREAEAKLGKICMWLFANHILFLFL
jgi:ATP-dependent Clp protease ATP-binding subunit ClpB